MKRNNLKKIAVNINRSVGDSIAGERVIAQARYISKPRVFSGTSRHNIQEVTLKNNVLCVIDREFRILRRKMRVKKK